MRLPRLSIFPGDPAVAEVTTGLNFDNVVVTGTPTAASSTPSGTLTIVTAAATGTAPAKATTIDVSADTLPVNVASDLNFEDVVVMGHADRGLVNVERNL